MKETYPKSYGRYSFRDAFNPLTGWYDKDSLGIDLGITLIQAENYRTGFVWKWFMKNQELQRAMKDVGFVSTAQLEWWAWLLIIVAVILAVGCVGFALWKFFGSKKKNVAEMEELKDQDEI